jgi:glycosyltransferase involved in cell wall biosynthesis
LFLSYKAEAALRQTHPIGTVEPYALFFARIEAYKGVDVLLEALRQLEGVTNIRAIIAGKGDVTTSTPANVEIRNRLLGDTEAIDLFARCSVVVLPYRDATQSALIAAAYFFGKPVIVTRTGALPEYVSDGTTGWIVEPGNAQALATCLRTALQDPARLQQMGQAGWNWYNTQYQQAAPRLRHMYECAAYS